MELLHVHVLAGSVHGAACNSRLPRCSLQLLPGQGRCVSLIDKFGGLQCRSTQNGLMLCSA